MPDISELSRATLLANGASELVISTVARMTECIREAAEDTADSTDDDLLYDDPTSRGGLLYRRARNRVIREFADDEDVVVSTSDNAVQVLVDGCAISFYSARDGLEQPHLARSSRTKRNVVDEMQMQLSIEAPHARRLVLMHESDEDGMTRAAVGVLRAGQEWAWSATTFNRFETPTAGVGASSSEPSYEEQEEVALPPIARRVDEATPIRGVTDNAGS